MKLIHLTNFNVPITTRNRFDAICHASGRTRTSVLVELMTNYILQEGKRLIDQQNEFKNLDMRFQKSPDLKGSNHQMDTDCRSIHSPRQQWADAGDELPCPLFSDGQGEW